MVEDSKCVCVSDSVLKGVVPVCALIFTLSGSCGSKRERERVVVTVSE